MRKPTHPFAEGSLSVKCFKRVGLESRLFHELPEEEVKMDAVSEEDFQGMNFLGLRVYKPEQSD